MVEFRGLDSGEFNLLVFIEKGSVYVLDKI